MPLYSVRLPAPPQLLSAPH